MHKIKESILFIYTCIHMNMYKLFSNHRACMYKRIRCSFNLTAYTNKIITLFSILPARTKN